MNSYRFRCTVGTALFLALLALLLPARTSAQVPGERQKKMAQLRTEFTAATVQAATKPTPRDKDGHPMLTGFWISGPDMNKAFPIQRSADGSVSVFIAEGGPEVGAVAPPPDRNPPPYKPEFLAKVKDNADNMTDRDPGFNCEPLGVPRLGPPLKIIANGNEVVFFYDPSEATPTFRFIPTDGRAHQVDPDPSYFGDSVAHWEGDTLVVDVTGFNDITWLGSRGYFHTADMHVVERLTRKGDTIAYQATVEDPKVLTGPWLTTPETLLLANDQQHFEDVRPCENRDAPHIVEKSNYDPAPPKKN
jgi:hypothetical protein